MSELSWRKRTVCEIKCNFIVSKLFSHFKSEYAENLAECFRAIIKLNNVVQRTMLFIIVSTMLFSIDEAVITSGVARLFKLGGHFIRWKIVGGAREKTSDKKTVPLTL